MLLVDWKINKNILHSQPIIRPKPPAETLGNSLAIWTLQEKKKQLVKNLWQDVEKH